jgi:predicted Zn-dependent protease
MSSRLLAIVLLLPAVALPQKKPAKQAEVKIQKSSLTRDQELQLGKEAAAQVEGEMEVVKSHEAEAWLNQIGVNLAKTPQANAYPYYFPSTRHRSRWNLSLNKASTPDLAHARRPHVRAYRR